MTRLNKNNSMFQRNDKGELLPIEITLETIENQPTILALPLTRGKFQEINAHLNNGETTKDQDLDIIVNHCVDPKFSEEEAVYIKPKLASAIVTGIMSASLGISQDKFNKPKEEIDSSEEELKN